MKRRGKHARRAAIEDIREDVLVQIAALRRNELEERAAVRAVLGDTGCRRQLRVPASNDECPIGREETEARGLCHHAAESAAAAVMPIPRRSRKRVAHDARQRLRLLEQRCSAAARLFHAVRIALRDPADVRHL